MPNFLSSHAYRRPRRFHLPVLRVARGNVNSRATMERLGQDGKRGTPSEVKYATVLIPTTLRDARTLPYSLQSIQKQSFSDMEIFVVGNGAPPYTRDLVHSFASSDSRIQFFEFPKGERLGEAHWRSCWHIRQAAASSVIAPKTTCGCLTIWNQWSNFLKTVDFGHS